MTRKPPKRLYCRNPDTGDVAAIIVMTTRGYEGEITRAQVQSTVAKAFGWRSVEKIYRREFWKIANRKRPQRFPERARHAFLILGDVELLRILQGIPYSVHEIDCGSDSPASRDGSAREASKGRAHDVFALDGLDLDWRLPPTIDWVSR